MSANRAALCFAGRGWWWSVCCGGLCCAHVAAAAAAMAAWSGVVAEVAQGSGDDGDEGVGVAFGDGGVDAEDAFFNAEADEVGAYAGAAAEGAFPPRDFGPELFTGGSALVSDFGEFAEHGAADVEPAEGFVFDVE